MQETSDLELEIEIYTNVNPHESNSNVSVTHCKKCITQRKRELLKIIFTFSCEKEA